jgi:AraC family transcriptional regulator
MKQELSATLDGYNHVINRFELNGFALSEAIYPPKLRQPRHTHEIAHISFVFQGSYTERHPQKAWNCHPSTVVFHPFGLTHSLDFDNAETRVFTVQIKPRWLDYVGEKPELFNRPSYFYGGMPVYLAGRLLREYRRRDLASPLAMEGLALELIAAANDSPDRRQPKSSRWIERTRDFLHAEFTKTLTIENVAKIAGVHPSHLARSFRAQTGYTIGDYVRRLRIEFASQQLSLTDASLGDIAAAAGFSDQSHLSRTFKMYFGVPPGEYRKISRAR